MQHRTVVQNVWRRGIGAAITYYSIVVLFADGSNAFARHLVGSGQGVILQHSEDPAAAAAAAAADVADVAAAADLTPAAVAAAVADGGAAAKLPSFLTEGNQQQQQQQQQEQQQQQQQQQTEGEEKLDDDGEEEHVSLEDLLQADEKAALAAIQEKVESGDISDNNLKEVVGNTFTAFLQQTEEILNKVGDAVTAIEEGDISSNKISSFLQDSEEEGEKQTDTEVNRTKEVEGGGGGGEEEEEEEDGEDGGEGLLGPRTKGLWEEAKEQAKATVDEVKDRTRK
ncbi:hypothetical protein, conserved [Eimeria praecox]|uniref:Uncharacterized protein n=1 Tax=Eimeria praecox TaxID=51316 RepID=U6H652_9EIME|nr:hypothetical protein, conserved [Eimeria praecox]